MSPPAGSRQSATTSQTGRPASGLRSTPTATWTAHARTAGPGGQTSVGKPLGDGAGPAGRWRAGTPDGRLPRISAPNPRQTGNSRGSLGGAHGYRAAGGGIGRPAGGRGG